MEFHIGDVVVLKSGSPDMTVTELANLITPDLLCVWFDHMTRHDARFPAEALMMASEKTDHSKMGKHR